MCFDTTPSSGQREARPRKARTTRCHYVNGYDCPNNTSNAKIVTLSCNASTRMLRIKVLRQAGLDRKHPNYAFYMATDEHGEFKNPFALCTNHLLIHELDLDKGFTKYTNVYTHSALQDGMLQYLHQHNIHMAPEVEEDSSRRASKRRRTKENLEEENRLQFERLKVLYERTVQTNREVEQEAARLEEQRVLERWQEHEKVVHSTCNDEWDLFFKDEVHPAIKDIANDCVREALLGELREARTKLRTQKLEFREELSQANKEVSAYNIGLHTKTKDAIVEMRDASHFRVRDRAAQI